MSASQGDNKRQSRVDELLSFGNEPEEQPNGDEVTRRLKAILRQMQELSRRIDRLSDQDF